MTVALARVGPKKNFEVHFRVSDSEGDRLVALCLRLGVDRSTAARDAVALLLQIGEARPELSGPHLSVFILESIGRALVASPGVAGRGAGASSRPRTDTKRHKPSGA